MDSVTPRCSKCEAVIPADDINVARDVAYCRACNLAHQLSALAQGAALEDDVDLDRPPAGMWFRREGTGMVVGATHRSVGAALGMLFVALFWNSIVSVFVCLALAATLSHLGIEPPPWFPDPEMNKSPMGVGMTVFLWLFLTPFILIGLVLAGVFLAFVAGRTEVGITAGEGIVFSGVGWLGMRRRFAVRDVKDVRIEDRQWRDSDGDRRRQTHIVIEMSSGRQIKLGSMLCDERRKYLAAALRKALQGLTHSCPSTVGSGPGPGKGGAGSRPPLKR